MSDEGSNGVAGIVPISDLNEERREMLRLKRAAREGWDVPTRDRPTIVKRMVGIVKRQSVTVATMNGPVDSEAVADSHAIRAAQVLVAMTGQDQADVHHEDKMAQDDKHLALGAMSLAAGMSDEQKIDLYIQSGRAGKLPDRLRELAVKLGKMSAVQP